MPLSFKNNELTWPGTRTNVWGVMLMPVIV